MNGLEGIRTLGLRDANAALSQLSHEPNTPLGHKQPEMSSQIFDP